MSRDIRLIAPAGLPEIDPPIASMGRGPGVILTAVALVDPLRRDLDAIEQPGPFIAALDRLIASLANGNRGAFPDAWWIEFDARLNDGTLRNNWLRDFIAPQKRNLSDTSTEALNAMYGRHCRAEMISHAQTFRWLAVQGYKVVFE